jgi:DNA polymerase III alpha subunit
MLIDNNPEDLIKGVMRFGPDILENCTGDIKQLQCYIDRIAQEHLDYPIPLQQIDPSHWFIPEKYRTMDIKQWLYQQCSTPETKQRVDQELMLFEKHHMMPVLNTMKYVVDTLRSNHIVWGVGRGSSVASYVLHIIGVHKIDSIKYNLPINEFFKGEQNG